MSRPMLRIKRLSVRGLGPIERLDLPEDGLGWGDEIPRMVLLGGPNGGGKTTLLNFIEAAMRTLAITDDNCDAVPEFLRTAGEEAWFDIEVTDGHAD
ncbi:MAG: hypothetical protein HYU66_13640, partial [Armatimonadetes bacterium]|nr:hypothetical protein [Armatimonadota bacterium]